MDRFFGTPFSPLHKNQKGTLFLTPCYLLIYQYTSVGFFLLKATRRIKTNSLLISHV